MTTDPDPALLAALAELAGAHPHSHRSLFDHLRGTHDLLRAWGAPRPVCLAGLFHSVYGTEAYQPRAVPREERPRVRALIGAEAERLAFLFCVADRDDLLENARRAPPWRAREAGSGEAHPLSPADFGALVDLTAANFLEQLPALGFTRGHPRVAALLARLGPALPHAREGARRAVEALLRDPPEAP